MKTYLRIVTVALVLTLGAGCISSDRQRAVADTAADTDVAEPDGVDADTAAPVCTDSDDCDDADPCTVDTCGDDGACQHAVVPGCQRCTLPSDCEGQGDVCEEARCDDGYCTYQVADGCRACDDTGVCNDGDACTVESCDGTCHYAAADCDDDDPCTVDACSALTGCTHEDTCDPPAVTLTDDPTLDEGDTLVRVGSFTGPASETFTATVDWGEGADPEPLTLEADGTFTLHHRYAADGAFTLVVRVVDGHERAGTADLQVTVANVAPTVLFEPVSALEEGGTLTVTGAVSDPGEDVTAAEIDWGDGADPEPVTLDAEGAFTLSHRYDDDGVFTLGLTASDDDEVGGDTLEITVANAVPHFVPPSNRVVLEGTPTVMTLPISDPGANDTFTGEVRYGLGAGPEPLVVDGHDLVITLDYPDDGTWPVTITLRDDDGGESVDGFVIAVTNVAPAVVDPGDQQLVEGTPLDIAATFTDPGQDTWTAQVSYGDGTPVASPTVDGLGRKVPLTHVWQDDGTFLAFVSVVDDDGGEDATTFTVSVENAPPVPNAGGDATLAEGSTFVRDAVAQDPGAGDVLSGTVRWGADEAEETLGIDVATRAYHLERGYDDEGVHEVTVTVRDDDGGSRSETFTLTVANVAPSIDCGSHAVLAAGGRLERVCTFVDPGADSWSGTIDWGDGGDPEPLVLEDGAFSVGHTFDVEATYSVVVTIDDGTEAGVTSFDVAVGNAPPLVDAGAGAAVDEGGSFVRTGQVYDSSVGTFTATVDYGEGDGPVALELTPGLAFLLDHAYAQDGEYDVVVSVTDPDDTTGTDVVRVVVANLPPAITAGGDATLSEGERLTRTVSIVDPGTEDTLTATVDYGDGGGASALTVGAGGEAQLDHVYTRDGDHTVTVTASDDDGGSASASFVARVANGAPVVAAGDDGDATEGASFARDVTFTDAGDDAWTLRVTWGDGTPQAEVTGVSPAAAVPLSHVYADDGDYTVTVTVSDGTDSGADSFVVHVANAAPVVDAGDAATIDEGQTFTRSGSVTDPGVLDTLTATVDWGDGPEALPLSAGGGFTLSRAFPGDGTHTVTVTATDGVASGSDSFVLTVGNVAPTVSVGAALTVAEGAELLRNATFTDPGADSWTATVDWDDGAGPGATAVGPGKTVKLLHTYPENGVHDVVVAVNDGVATGTAQLQVTVTNVAPTVDAGGDVGLSEGGTLSRTGTVTDPGTVDTFTATVDYGEGGVQPLTITAGRTFALSHTYPSQGTYTVKVTVTDDDNGVGTDTFLVTVSNTAPVVSAGADAELDEGGLLTRQVGFSDSGADTWTATVDYGDGAGPQPAAVDAGAKTVALSHTYLDDGDYEVVVTVSDGVETGQGSFRVVVANVTPAVSAGSPASTSEGTTWTRPGSFTDPGLLDPHTATVDWGDGSAPASLTLSAQGTFTLSHAFADNGSYDVVVTVTDDDGAGTATIPVTVTNVAPDLPASLGTIALDVGETWSQSVSFTDPGADTWTLQASYGDTPATVTPLASRTFNILHTYWTPGQYTASFGVTDDDSGTDVVSAVVNVANVAPTVEASDPQAVPEGSPVVVTATFADPGSEAHTATMTWAEGVVGSATVDEAGEFVTASHIYGDEGEHDVVVTVTDAYDASGSDVAHVVVTNVAPTVDAGADGSTTPLGVLVRQGSFTDPGNDVWTVTADWGDGSAPENIVYLEDKRFVLSHTYASNGSYTVLVTVSDGDGGVGTATFDVAATVLDCSEVTALGQQWVGGAASNPTGWGEAANWNPAGVPAAQGDVYLCANNVYYPVLSQGTYVHSVHMAPTASIATGGRPLSVSGDLLGGSVTGSGTVTMSGTDVVLGTDVPALVVSGRVDATRAVTIAGALTLSDGASFGPHDVTVTVRGALSVWSSATGTGLVLDGADDVVAVGGAFTAWPGTNGGSSPVSTLTAGRLVLSGSFTQRGGPSGPIAFFAAGTVVELVGAVDQNVSFEDPGPTRSRFADLSLPGSHTVALKSDVAVTGKLSLTGAVTLTSAKKLMLSSELPSLGANAVYDVATTAIVGSVTVQDDFYLAGTHHALSIEGGGVLHVGPYTVDLDGDLSVRIEGSTSSGLHMNDASSEISVGGQATFLNTMGNGGDTLLEAGTLWLQGGLTVSGTQAAAAAFAPAGMTTYILGAGDGVTHDVSFVSPTKNRFDTLVLMPGVRMNLLTAVQVAGTLYADNNDRAVVSGGHTLAAASLDVAGVDFDQVPVLTTNLVRLTDATFLNQPADGDQLTIVASTLNATVRRLRFETLPTNGGAYIYGVANGNGQALVHLTVEESAPLHGLPWCRVANGFAITWGTETDDTDADGLSDAAEHDLGTDPLDDDSDDDTFLDGTEVGVGTSPLSALDAPFHLATPVGYAVGASPAAVAVGDLDGDGALDLAVANEGSDSVTVWYADPTAPTTFEQRVDVPLVTGAAPRGLTIATLRGKAYVLVTETGADKLAFVGRPESAELLRSLARLSALDTCDAPNDVVLVGPQGTSQIDLAVSCGGANAVRVFRSVFSPTGDGLGWTQNDYTVGAAPNAIVAGDLTAATSLDIATSNGAGSVSVLLGGVYTPVATFTEPGALGLAVADLQNVGWLEDLIVARSTSDQISVLYNDGPTGTTSAMLSDVGAAPRGVAVGDLDGNGWLDIATAATGDDAVSVLLQPSADNEAKGILYPHTVPGLDGAGEYDVLLTDLGDDGKVDFVVVARTLGQVVVIKQVAGGVVGPF